MIRAFQWDLARQVERLDWLVAQLPRYAAWGYQELYLHLEDAVDYPSLPEVARADAYTYREFATLVEAAGRVGIKVVPIVNLLGHTQYLIKVPELRDLNELRAADGSPLSRGQICPSHPRTMEVAEKLLRDVAPFCTAGKVHVGLDESFQLGRHPLSRADIIQRGLPAHFAGYARQLRDLSRSLDLRMGMWADMLYFIPGAIPLLPRDVIAYDWYYYPFRRHPRVELFNFAERDLAGPLRRQGIEYWGCPMNGAFRFEPLPIFGERLANIRAWWERCRRTNAGGFLVTSWETYRLALEMTTVVDAAAASLWLDPAAKQPAAMLAQGFARVFGSRGAKPAARAALACDRRAFAGYARWEINGRWNGCAGRESIGAYQQERDFFARLGKQSLPAPFAASVAFRLYLAERDVFVRQAAAGVFRLRRLLRQNGRTKLKVALSELTIAGKKFQSTLRAGRTASRAMWQRTRDPKARGQNDAILAGDAVRLRAWQSWLGRARSHPGIIAGPTLVCGTWQLRFMVHNFAPALQKIVVEQARPDGTWEELGSRFTIEFRAAAAQPRTGLAREFNLPVERPEARLRVAVRGLGQVAIARPELTDGRTTLAPHRWPARQKKILGRRAPARGWPALDWDVNVAAIPLLFSSQ
jgi:hypothetical protein